MQISRPAFEMSASGSILRHMHYLYGQDPTLTSKNTRKENICI